MHLTSDPEWGNFGGIYSDPYPYARPFICVECVLTQVITPFLILKFLPTCNMIPYVYLRV